MDNEKIREGLEATLSTLEDSVWVCMGNPANLLAAHEDPRENNCLLTAMPKYQRGVLVKTLGFENNARLFAWNDHPERTLEEVRERINKAIKELQDA